MSHRANVLGRRYSNRHLDSPRVRFRRALTLCLMTIVAPGWAQLVVGNKWIGRIALAGWVALLGGSGYLVYTARTELGQFADLALKSRNEKIATVSLAPPRGLHSQSRFRANQDLDCGRDQEIRRNACAGTCEE